VASGKGTLSRRLAQTLGFDYLDTGLLYRAVGLATLQAGHDPADEVAATKAAGELKPDGVMSRLHDPALRSETVGQAVSVVSAIPEVRAALLAFQRNFATHPPGGKGAILDGRDIGTVVCPDALVKIFVTASPEERAERRLKELLAKGHDVTYDGILADIKARDARDSGRATAPLKPAVDAVILDTTALDAEGTFQAALKIVSSRLTTPAKG
jgi:cytidylate kinase